MRELAAHDTALDNETAKRVLIDTTRWLEKRRLDEEERALTQRLRDGDENWRTVLLAKERRRAQPEAQENRRIGLTT